MTSPITTVRPVGAIGGGDSPPPDLGLGATATAFLARFLTQPSDAVKLKYDAFFKTTGVAAILAKLDAFYLLAGPDMQSALLNLCASDTSSVVGSLTHTAGSGIAANGNFNYVSSNKMQSQLTHYTQNDACHFVYAHSVSGAAANVSGTGGTTLGTRLAVRSSGGEIIGRINAPMDTTTSGGLGGDGFIAVVRTGASELEIYKDGSSVMSNTTASVARVDDAMFLFRAGTFYTAATSCSIYCWGFGASLTGAEQTTLKGAVDAFLA